jgi:Flp pilus assembly protein TadG
MYQKERGQALVIFAIGVVVLLILAALAIDAGNAYTAKREAQNAADAAAMAGTRQMLIECSGAAAPNEANILEKVGSLAGANIKGSVQAFYIKDSGVRLTESPLPIGAVPCGCAVTSARGVQVVVNSSRQSFFAGLMGKDSTAVQATAKARYAPTVSNGEGLYPFTRKNTEIEYGQLVTLRILDDADTLPGSFGWLTWNGVNNIPNLAESLTPPGDAPEKYFNPGTPDNNWTPDHNDKAIAVGKWVQGAPGNKNGAAVRAQLDWHIANETPMVIPLYDAVAGQGSHSNYRVASFAAFELQSYDFGGQDKSMTGKFLRWVTNGTWTQAACEESGLFSVQLTP